MGNYLARQDTNCRIGTTSRTPPTTLSRSAAATRTLCRVSGLAQFEYHRIHVLGTVGFYAEQEEIGIRVL